MLKLLTIQASAFKSTFEVLKDILNDVNIYFKTDGMYIVTLDTARTSLIDMYLSADNFEEYSCTEDLEAGVNMSNMHKLLKTITNNDVLAITIDSKEYMNIEIHSESKRTCTKFALKLLDINENQIEVPDVHMTMNTSLPSVDFQRMCRDMLNIGDTVELTSTNDGLLFRCNGDFARQETLIGETTHGLTFNKKDDELITGKFALKYINLFTKSTNLCNTIELYLKPDYPLILKYNVANLGEIRFCLAPKCE